LWGKIGGWEVGCGPSLGLVSRRKDLGGTSREEKSKRYAQKGRLGFGSKG